jgi:hypothetical protein
MRTTITGLLAGLLLVLGMPAATAGDPDFGRVWRGDGVLRQGCHNYKYQYRVKPPTKVWALETFLVDRRGETVASGVLGYGADPKRGTAKFRFCRYNTVPGKFKVRGKLTWYITNEESKVRWVEPDHFRLRRAS